MAARITPVDLAKRLPEILERVRDNGERFVVEEDGAPFATISPPELGPAKSLQELGERLAGIPWPDEDFADDLEEIHRAMNRPVKPPEWPS
jgi:antitoxin (DNA-binding transcriptional repressor) of toxin-antitoxin stability system